MLINKRKALSLGFLLIATLMLLSPARLYKYYVPLIIVADNSITDVLIEVNIARKLNNCNPLILNNTLSIAAQEHTNTMNQRKKLEHSDLSRITNVYGYKWSKLGENVLVGVSSGKPAAQVWLQSPPHKANILDCVYTETGIAKSGVYWTQILAKPL